MHNHIHGKAIFFFFPDVRGKDSIVRQGGELIVRQDQDELNEALQPDTVHWEIGQMKKPFLQ